MYVPKHFALEDRAELVRFIRSEPFGILVSAAGHAPVASHLPFVVQDGEPLVLLAHLARANRHWEMLDGAEVLVIFQGAHGLVSASWYAEPAQSVPTWNYGAVHCTGRASVTGGERVAEILRETTAQLESGWSMDVPEPEYIERMQRGVVGVEIVVERIEGKMKYSQNRTPEDRARVLARLRESPRARDRELAEQMAAYGDVKV